MKSELKRLLKRLLHKEWTCDYCEARGEEDCEEECYCGDCLDGHEGDCICEGCCERGIDHLEGMRDAYD